MMAEGTHDGYAPDEHRRMVVHGRHTGWLIVDCVDGATKMVDSHWHFNPAWRVSVADGGLLAMGPAGARAWLLNDDGVMSLFKGDEAPGWCSPRYGSLVPTFAARVRRSGAPRGPQVTWIGVDAGGQLPRLRRLEAGSDRQTIAVNVDHGGGSTLTIVRPADVWAPGRFTQCGDVRSDGRLVQLRTAGRFASVSITDASFLDAPASAFMQISAAEPFADLHMAIDGTDLELWSTSPASELRVRLNGPHRADRLHLNGREVRLATGGLSDLSIRRAEWGITKAGPAPVRGYRSGCRVHLRRGNGRRCVVLTGRIAVREGRR